MDGVSGHACGGANQHALPVERSSLHLAAEAAEVSGGAGTADGATGAEHRDVPLADGGGGQTRHLGAAGLLQYSPVAHVREGARRGDASVGADAAWRASTRSTACRSSYASIRTPGCS